MKVGDWVLLPVPGLSPLLSHRQGPKAPDVTQDSGYRAHHYLVRTALQVNAY